MTAPLTEEQLLNKALNYINYRPRSQKEVEQKLKTIGALPDQIKGLCALLEENGLLNDEKVISPILKDCLENKGQGISRTKADLRRKGFAPFLIEDALQEYCDANPEFSEEGAALGALKRKYSRTGLPEDDSKALAFLGRRGFSYGAASKALTAHKKTPQ